MVDPLPESTPAPFGRRVFARGFDLFVVAVVAVPVLALTLQEDGPDDVRFPAWVIVLYGALPALWEARMLATRGTTPGKRLSGLVVRDRRLGIASFPVAFVRSVVAWSAPALALLLLPWAGVLGVLAAIVAPLLVPGVRRDLADLVSGTQVRFIGELTDDEPDR